MIKTWRRSSHSARSTWLECGFFHRSNVAVSATSNQSFPFFPDKVVNWRLCQQEKKNTAQHRRGSNLGLPIAGWTFSPLSYEATTGSSCEFFVFHQAVRLFNILFYCFFFFFFLLRGNPDVRAHKHAPKARWRKFLGAALCLAALCFFFSVWSSCQFTSFSVEKRKRKVWHEGMVPKRTNFSIWTDIQLIEFSLASACLWARTPGSPCSEYIYIHNMQKKTTETFCSYQPVSRPESIIRQHIYL